MRFINTNRDNSKRDKVQKLTVCTVLVLISLIVVFAVGRYFYAPARLWIYYRQNFSGDNFRIEKWIKGTTKITHSTSRYCLTLVRNYLENTVVLIGKENLPLESIFGNYLYGRTFMEEEGAAGSDYVKFALPLSLEHL